MLDWQVLYICKYFHARFVSIAAEKVRKKQIQNIGDYFTQDSEFALKLLGMFLEKDYFKMYQRTCIQCYIHSHHGSTELD